MSATTTTIPAALVERRQWCLWRRTRDTKVPYQVNGRMAKSNDPATWCSYASAARRFKSGGFSGIGYVFAASDPFVGIDLDGCRNPETGEVAEWAQRVINRLDTYAEISPSKTGVKLWMRGVSPFGERGRKVVVPYAPHVCDKTPAIEIYDRTRYFAVTGWRLTDTPQTINQNDSVMEWLAATYFGN